MREAIEHLRDKAVRCRRLAASASDSEVARTLRETAADIDAAIPVLEAAFKGREP